LKEFNEHLSELDSQSLLLWDVDKTLVIPNDQILTPGNEKMFKHLLSLYLSDKSIVEREKLISIIFHRTSFDLIDPSVINMIEYLKSKSIPMIAFTAMSTGTLGVISNMENWRRNQLELLGIDFSSTFPQNNRLYLHDTFHKGSPVFFEGVLCSDQLPKGPVLATFLEKINWKPQKIIFIDDDFDFLSSVEESLAKLNIPFLGIHYVEVDNRQFTVDSDVAHFQFQVLAKEGKWLIDQEAKSALNQPAKLN
jgi:uncharacterized protein DUF2608